MPDNPNELEGQFNWNSFYRAKVIDSKDPEKQGRVKLWIPDIMPEIDDDVGIWAYPANNPMGGANNIEDGDDQHFQGTWYVPVVGSYLYIFFESGDPNKPRYFSGGDFGQRRAPIENQQGDNYDKKWTIIKTRQGRVIIVSDDPHDERTEITGKKRKIDEGSNGQTSNTESIYTINDNQSVILIDDRDGKEKILIKDFNGNFININSSENKIDIESTGELNVKSSEDLKVHSSNNIHIKSDSDISIQGSNINIKGDSVKIEASNDVSVKGTNIKGEATSKFSAKGGSEMTLEGTIMNTSASGKYGINAGAILALDGASVSIQNGASTAVPADPADPASEAETAEPNGERQDPSTTDSLDDIVPNEEDGGSKESPDTFNVTRESPTITNTE